MSFQLPSAALFRIITTPTFSRPLLLLQQMVSSSSSSRVEIYFKYLEQMMLTLYPAKVNLLGLNKFRIYLFIY